MRHSFTLGSALCAALATLICAPTASAQALQVGVIGPNLKVRPGDSPAGAPSAKLFAAKNEFESFQLVMTSSGGSSAGVAVSLSKPLTGPGGAMIPPENVVLYVERYHQVGTASNKEGGTGRWPDPLVPDVDTYFGEKRNAFPLVVPQGESRLVWVDVLVPQSAVSGDYSGELEVTAPGQGGKSVPIELRVGSFELPSTASLKSAFGMAWAAPCIAHTGSSSCGSSWNEQAANKLRELYLRSGLEHRFTISDTDYQPPLGGSAAPFEQYVLPLISGTGPTRLPGARLTAVRLDGGSSSLGAWTSYAKDKGFFDRLFFYPVDEPGSSGSMWSSFISGAKALHGVDPTARIIITSSIQSADAFGATSHVDIFVPVINHLEDKPSTDHAGNQRSKYNPWLAERPNRELWAYQSCMSHGCGGCGAPTTSDYFTGWPQRVIDSTAVQNRAFSWVAFNLDIVGELYFDSTHQLSTAWNDNGQCEFSGSGDGTIFYPGKPSVIGGQSDIPIESIRMKLIRESMEDYEYLVLAAKKDEAKARAIAQKLFPKAYECNQSAEALESARAELFAMLDVPGPASPPEGSGGSAGQGASGAGSSGSSNVGGGGGDAVEAGPDTCGGNGCADFDDNAPATGGCACRSSVSTKGDRGAAALVFALLLALGVRRR
jgi:hypothetical protein